MTSWGLSKLWCHVWLALLLSSPTPLLCLLLLKCDDTFLYLLWGRDTSNMFLSCSTSLDLSSMHLCIDCISWKGLLLLSTFPLRLWRVVSVDPTGLVLLDSGADLATVPPSPPFRPESFSNSKVSSSVLSSKFSSSRLMISLRFVLRCSRHKSNSSFVSFKSTSSS